MPEPITSRDIAHQVTESLGADVADHDVAAIVADITDTYGRVDTDTIDDAEYWSLVAKHER